MENGTVTDAGKVGSRPSRYRNIIREIRRLRPQVVMEIGVLRGDTAEQMIREMIAYSDTPLYIGFDLFEESDSAEFSKGGVKSREKVFNRLDKIGNAKITLVKGNTRDTLKKYHGPKADLIFIDGGHSLETVASDFRHASKLLNPGGVILMDDYYHENPDKGCRFMIDKPPKGWKSEVLKPSNTFPGTGAISIAKMIHASDAPKYEVINFLTFFWGNKYTERHVSVLYNALTEYCHFDFKLHVLTDRPLAVSPDIAQYELWGDYSKEKGCWRRLRAFSHQAMIEWLPRYFVLDIDLMIYPDFPKLVLKNYSNPFTLCRAENPTFSHSPYSGTLWQVGDLRVTDREIWQPFCRMRREPQNMPIYRMRENLFEAGFDGTDSALLSVLFQGKQVHSIGSSDGVYSIPLHFVPNGWTEPPHNTKLILFHGRANDPLDSQMASRYNFVSEYLKKFN